MTDPQVDAIVTEYGDWMRSWMAAEKTISARTTLARSRLTEWGLDGFTSRNIQAFLARDGLSRWTLATYHANLKSFCQFLIAAGYLPKPSPMKKVRKVRRPRQLPRPLSEAQLALALATAKGHTRDWIVLALDAGLRAHEIAKLRGEDVTEDGIYVRGKGDTDAVLPDHPDIRAMAARYPTTGYWFPSPHGGHIQADSVSKAVGKLFRDLGIKGSIHRVRHNYGTRLLRADVHPRRVQQLMRHATLETTTIYTAVDEDELREAINRLPSSA